MNIYDMLLCLALGCDADESNVSVIYENGKYSVYVNEKLVDPNDIESVRQVLLKFFQDFEVTKMPEFNTRPYLYGCVKTAIDLIEEKGIYRDDGFKLLYTIPYTLLENNVKSKVVGAFRVLRLSDDLQFILLPNAQLVCVKHESWGGKEPANLITELELILYRNNLVSIPDLMRVVVDDLDTAADCIKDVSMLGRCFAVTKGNPAYCLTWGSEHLYYSSNCWNEAENRWALNVVLYRLYYKDKFEASDYLPQGTSMDLFYMLDDYMKSVNITAPVDAYREILRILEVSGDKDAGSHIEDFLNQVSFIGG